jgi:hypothetical protein
LAPAVLGSPSQNFVNQVYVDLLGRNAEPGGLAFWSGLVDGGVSRDQVVAGIQMSLEYRTDEVQRLYQRFLGRAADPLGLQNAVNYLGQGGRAEQFAILMLSSPEFFQINGNDNARFIGDVYELLLDETIAPAPKAAAEMAWVQVLASGVSRFTVVTAIFNGIQNVQRQVNLEYIKLLDRNADTGGLNSFVTVEQQSGIEIVINGIVASPEYFNRAQINPVQVPGTTVTTTTLTSSLASAALNQAVTLMATVNPSTVGPFIAAGSVVFADGGNALATVALTGGTASFTTTALTAGSHTISAAYSGDVNFAASAGSTSVSVNQAATTVGLTSSAGTSNLGQMLTFTASVTPDTLGTLVASGTVSFLDGNTALGTAPLNSGTATFMTGAIGAGSHQITAVYSGDANFAGSMASTPQVVNPVATTAMLISSARVSNPNQPVTFMANIGPSTVGSFTASGSVTFEDNGVVLGTVGLSNGAAMFTTSTLPPGNHTITATYSGDGNFMSSSAAFAQTVNLAVKVVTTTQVVSSMNPSNLNQMVTLTATVNPPSSGPFAVTGTVTFSDGNTALGTVGLNGNVATLSVATLKPGSHLIIADYNGDANFNPSTGTLTQNVNTVGTTITLASSAPTAVFGQTLTFTATVSPNIQNAGTPTGTVMFLDGNTALGMSSLQVVNGQYQASFTPAASLSAGTHAITAVYQGDSTFAGATSTILNQTINKSATTTTLTPSLNPSVFGQSVTLTAVVSVNAPGAGMPTGSVTFKDGSTVLGSGSLVLVNGQFQATISPSIAQLPGGAHSITASYSGDNSFSSSTSAVLPQTVTRQPTTVVVNKPTLLNMISGGEPNATILVTVSATRAGSPTPLGTVTLSLDNVPIGGGAQTLSGGAFTYTIQNPGLLGGTHTLSVAFTPNDSQGANYQANTGSVGYTITLTDDGDPVLGEQAVAQDMDFINGVSDDIFALF